MIWITLGAFFLGFLIGACLVSFLGNNNEIDLQTQVYFLRKCLHRIIQLDSKDTEFILTAKAIAREGLRDS
jgi:hypothetical protein